MVRTSLAEFKTWGTFAGFFVWLFWLDWDSWVQMCICLCTSLFLSLALRSCALPHPQPFTSPPNAAADGHHLCQEEPKVLSTSIWPLRLELCALLHDVVWPSLTAPGHSRTQAEDATAPGGGQTPQLVWNRQLPSCAMEFDVQRPQFLVSCMFCFCSISPS